MCMWDRSLEAPSVKDTVQHLMLERGWTAEIMEQVPLLIEVLNHRQRSE